MAFDWRSDGLRILKGAGVAAAGCVLTYLTTEFGRVDLGADWTPIVVAAWSVAANAARVWMSDTRTRI